MPPHPWELWVHCPTALAGLRTIQNFMIAVRVRRSHCPEIQTSWRSYARGYPYAFDPDHDHMRVRPLDIQLTALIIRMFLATFSFG